MIKVLLIYGGPSGEHDISLQSAQVVAKNLDSHKYDVVHVVVGRDGEWRFLPGPDGIHQAGALKLIQEEHFDVAMIMIHGEFGEDGQLQMLFDSIQLPYIGSGPVASALAMDKVKTNVAYRDAGFTVPDFFVITRFDDLAILPNHCKYPLILKPVHGGSSVNMAIVHDEDGLRSFVSTATRNDDLIAQEYIIGREFTCGILEKDDGSPLALPPTEIIPKGSSFFDYTAKYTPGATQEITPPNLPHDQILELQNLALKAHAVLGCQGICRSDFILRDGIWYILETNTIPGMTETSLIPQEAKSAGIDFPELLDMLINSALNNKK